MKFYCYSFTVSALLTNVNIVKDNCVCQGTELICRHIEFSTVPFPGEEFQFVGTFTVFIQLIFDTWQHFK